MKNFISSFTLLLLLAGCTENSYRTPVLDATFGQSYKQVTQAQILNPQAAAEPLPTVPEGMDADVGRSIMGTYRDSFEEVEDVESITINVGGSSSSSGN